MPTFVNPTLLWGLLIVALPVLIHLINLMRHRRVQWAAMEFLLASQKKNNTWIKLKELLLLLLRMAAIAAVVLLVAQPLMSNQLSRWFGGTNTHHIVLLDDSFSMSDRWADTSAFDQAKAAIGRLAEQVGKQATPQTFTLLRYSRATSDVGGAKTDLLAEQVDAEFGNRVRELLGTFAPSQLSVKLDQPLAILDDLLGHGAGEDRVIYVVSDFRARDWEDPGELADQLAELAPEVQQLQFIDCVDGAHGNLAISALEAEAGMRAAGVELPMRVTVTNYGGAAVSGVTVMLQEDGQERPAVDVEEIAPGKSETHQFKVRFPTAGVHRVAASLAADAVAADNVRHALVDVPLSVPVLLIDGDPDGGNARFLAAAMAPGGAVRTGIDPRIEPAAYLNNHALDSFAVIYLLDVDRLDRPAIEALEKYVRAGGGLCMFVGQQTRARFVNDQLYRDGQGLFPLPLGGETQLIVDRLETGNDIEVEAHPLFEKFAGERNSFLNAVTVERYYSAAKGWETPKDAPVEVIARLRNGAPLVVERKLDAGRVVAFLTTASPTWNNWARNPSFIITALESVAYLSKRPAVEASRLVGVPIELRLDPARYQSNVRLIAPGFGESGSLSVEAAPVDGVLRAAFPETTSSGVYDVRLTTVENQPEVRLYAYNVEPAEGDLAILGRDALAERLPGVDFDYRQAVDFQFAAHAQAGANLSDWLIYALVLGLVVEQLLAYSASYHPPAAKGVR